MLLREEEVVGLNRKYRRMYDWIPLFYDLLATTVGPLFRVSEVLAQIAEILDVGYDDRVLETSVGTGRQIKNLVDHGMRGRFIGMDLSHGMLRRCRRNARGWQIDLPLVQANAETLPFEDEVFDVVFHIGGINFFEDKESAIREMIRAARPRGRIYIGDETQKLLEEQPSVLSRFYERADPEVYAPPLQLIPRDMLEITRHELWDDKMYMISFEKPWGK